MKTKLLVGIGLSVILGTAVYAYNSSGSCNMMDKSFNGEKNYKGMMNHKGGSNSIMSMLYKLNLSAEQQNQVFEIKKDLMKKRVSPNVAFTEDGFDKEKFIKIMKQKRDNMIESKAEMIEKIYKVLTPKQKEQLKVLMELKNEREISYMNKRMTFDKNCNGRR